MKKRGVLLLSLIFLLACRVTGWAGNVDTFGIVPKPRPWEAPFPPMPMILLPPITIPPA